MNVLFQKSPIGFDKKPVLKDLAFF